MKLVVKPKPVTFHIQCDGVDHTDLQSLREHFNLTDIKARMEDGSLKAFLRKQKITLAEDADIYRVASLIYDAQITDDESMIIYLTRSQRTYTLKNLLAQIMSGKKSLEDRISWSKTIKDDSLKKEIATFWLTKAKNLAKEKDTNYSDPVIRSMMVCAKELGSEEAKLELNNFEKKRKAEQARKQKEEKKRLEEEARMQKESEQTKKSKNAVFIKIQQIMKGSTNWKFWFNYFFDWPGAPKKSSSYYPFYNSHIIYFLSIIAFGIKDNDCMSKLCNYKLDGIPVSFSQVRAKLVSKSLTTSLLNDFLAFQQETTRDRNKLKDDRIQDYLNRFFNTFTSTTND